MFSPKSGSDGGVAGPTFGAAISCDATMVSVATAWSSFLVWVVSTPNLILSTLFMMGFNIPFGDVMLQDYEDFCCIRSISNLGFKVNFWLWKTLTHPASGVILGVSVKRRRPGNLGLS